MEYDCEMFDDSEAALDALLARASWDRPDEQMTERLKALVVAGEDLQEAPAEMPVVTWASGPWGDPSHEPDARVTVVPVEVKPQNLSRRRRPIPFFLAMAACLLLAIGAAFLLVHRAMKPTIVATIPPVDINSLPGRAPTPMELWMTSPRGQKRLQTMAQQRPHVDPEKARLAEFIRASDTRTLAARLSTETNDTTRVVILQNLFSRPDGMDRYLDLVLDPSKRDQALDALESLPHPPTQRLVSALDSPQVARRFAAAKALGSLCHGDVLPSLKRMIEQDNHRREALAVLIECKDSDAEHYVQQIQKQPSLGSELNVVRDEMQKLF